MWQSTRQTLRETLARVSQAVSLADDGRREPDADLLTEFVAAARGSSSFFEAFERALATLRERLGAQSVVLLEQVSREYRALVAIPEDAGPRRPLPAGAFSRAGSGSTATRCPSRPAISTAGCGGRRDHYPEHVAEIQTLLDSGARMAVALRAKGDILGLLLLGPPASGGQYSAGEKHLLRQCAEQLTLMIENARLTTRMVEQEKLRRDVALGG